MVKKIKALVFDLDGTIVHYQNSNFFSSWDALGSCLDEEGIRTKNLNKEKYYSQKNKIEEWTIADTNLFKGISLSDANRVLFPGGMIPYNPGFTDFLKNTNNGYVLGIVSGGVGLVSDQIQKDFPEKFNFVIINRLGQTNGFLDGTVEIINMWKKDELLEQKLKDNYNISLDNVCFVGDSGNDISTLKRVGLPIVFDSKCADSQEVKKYAKHIIGDFRQLGTILKKYS